jgi:AraC-like DNA-binding protein
MMGETTDERDIVFSPGETHRDAISRFLSGTSRWLVLEDVPLVTQSNGRTEVIGQGWNALTPVRSRKRMVGMFANDAALTKAAFDEHKQAELAVLATIVGNSFELKGLDVSGLPWTPTLPRGVDGSPSLRALVLSPDVRQAILLMRETPAVSTSKLAKATAVTPRALAKHFRNEVGVSLVDYRNRLRLERFIELALAGGNLLEAAFDAGFGSYAQFHRVFRQQLGATPKEYLSGQRSSSAAPREGDMAGDAKDDDIAIGSAPDG